MLAHSLAVQSGFRDTTQRCAKASGKMWMCGAADMRMFKWVNCGELLRGLSADVMGKMQRCGYVITLSSSSSVS